MKKLEHPDDFFPLTKVVTISEKDSTREYKKMNCYCAADFTAMSEKYAWLKMPASTFRLRTQNFCLRAKKFETLLCTLSLCWDYFFPLQTPFSHRISPKYYGIWDT